MSYIVKRSDGAVWAQGPGHPSYGWFHDQPPAMFDEERDAKQCRLRVKSFRVPENVTVIVEEVP